MQNKLSARCLLSLMTTLLGAALLSGCGSTPEKPQSLIAADATQANIDGQKRYAQGEYAAAVDAFNEALRLSTSIDDQAAITLNRINLARSLLGMGDASAALEQATRVSETQAGSATAIRAQALQQLGRWDESEALLTDAIAQCKAQCSSQASLKLLLARQYLRQSKAQAALALGTESTALLRGSKEGPDNPTELANALRLCAEAYLALNQKPQAAQAANEALSLDKALGLPARIAYDLILLGHAQAPKEALVSYQRAIDVAKAAKLSTLQTQAEQAHQARLAVGN